MGNFYINVTHSYLHFKLTFVERERAQKANYQFKMGELNTLHIWTFSVLSQKSVGDVCPHVVIVDDA